jgi:hypothetical protein
VVANGRDGFAMRDAGGTWKRIGFPEMVGPAAENLPAVPTGSEVNLADRGSDLIMSVMFLLTLAFSTITVGAARMLHRSERQPAWWLLVLHQPVSVPILALLLAAQSTEILPVMLMLVGGPAVTLLTLVTAIFGVAFTLARRRVRGRWGIEVALAGVLTLVLSGLVLGGWFTGLLLTGWAVPLAVLAAVPGIALAVWASRRTLA